MFTKFAEFAKFATTKRLRPKKNPAIFCQKNELCKHCEGVHCVNLVKRFRTHIYLQNLASIQPRTSPLKIAENEPSQSRKAINGTPRVEDGFGRREEKC